MPGFHFVYSLRSGLTRDTSIPPLDHFLYDRRFLAEIIQRDDRAFLGVTRYPEYPVTVIENDAYLFLLEGRLHGFGAAAIERELAVLAEGLFCGDNEMSRAGAWIEGHDGDYIIVAHHKPSGRWAAVNDPLGRLPVYYRRQGETIALSRDLRFMAALSPAPALDRMALGQFLVLGFPLGTRTLLAGIDRLPAGSLVQCGGRGDGGYRTVSRFNFDDVHPVASPRTAAESLAARFIEACARVTDPEKSSVLSLSGGMDSRTVAAGLIKAGRRFHAATYAEAGKERSADVIHAREVADALGFDRETISLRPSRGADLLRLLRMKGGMNSAGLAFYLPFLEEIGRRYGHDAGYLTGDGGDKALPALVPPRRLRSNRDLVRFILGRHDILPIDRVARLVRLPVSDLEGQIETMVDGYPERSPDRKYVHFIIYERGMKWLFEGEDRNRCLLWSATPFYDQSFFREAMACPMECKQRRRLYRDFLTCLSPVAAGIIDSNKGVPITAPGYARKEMVFDLLARFPSLSRRLKNKLRPPRSYDLSSAALTCLKQQAVKCPVIEEYLDGAELMRLIDTPSGLSRAIFDNLLTVTAAIEMYTGAKETLDDFQEVEFR